MSNDTKSATTWAPECPRCRKVTHIHQERRDSLSGGWQVHLVMACEEGHAWLAEFFEMYPVGGESDSVVQG